MVIINMYRQALLAEQQVPGNSSRSSDPQWFSWSDDTWSVLIYLYLVNFCDSFFLCVCVFLVVVLLVQSLQCTCLLLQLGQGETSLWKEFTCFKHTFELLTGRGCSWVDLRVRHAADIRFDSPVFEGFSPRLNFQCRLLWCLQPPCAVACIDICAHVKNYKHWQLYHCFYTWK